jgi:predicted dehydrogenase
MTALTRLVIAGIGLVGKRHAEAIYHLKSVDLAGIVDPSDAGRIYAADRNLPWFESLSDMFAKEQPDGVVLATPTPLHVEQGLECVAQGCPTLVEKPRHNPLIQKVREVVDAGKLGQLRAVHANCWLYKPDEYFDEAPWRKAPGAGPISVNLVHDVDLIRYLCGDVVSVRAQATPSARGYENEDVAAAVLRLENGAIGTITVSDTIVSPWSWELTARENPAYPPTSQSCYLLGGTHGSLSLPDLTLWQNNGMRSWWQPISAITLPHDSSDPLVNQIAQFAAVIRGEEQPLVSGEEGLKTLRVIEAIQSSAKSGETVVLQC